MYHQTRFTARKIEQRIKLIEPLVYRKRHLIAPFRFQTAAAPPHTAPLDVQPVGVDVDDSGWETIQPLDYWAVGRVNFALRTRFSVPSDFKGEIALFLPLGEAGDFSHPEALIYIDGQRIAACDRHHQEVLLPSQFCDGREHLLALAGWTSWQDTDKRLQMRLCEVVQIDRPTRDFSITARIALEVANELEENHPAKNALYNGLDAAFKHLDTREPFGDAFYASVPAAHTLLRDGVTTAGAPLDVNVASAGHAHIDVAWLWTLGQTRRKAGRTFSTVLHLMDQFPDYTFTQSQPQLYDYIKNDYPDVFEGIKSRVADGRWEPIGGMWIEADCNLSGAESLARQFLLGRSFFREHFGAEAESPVLWLPDVFGYAWALPQLIKQARLEYFFTIKISWNQFNRLPYDSFWWQGIDGTQVLTHFSPVYNYNAGATPKEIMDAWRKFQQKEHQTEVLMSFGYGDGGGGPTREMLENIRELGSFPGAPQTRHDKVGNFFRVMESQVGENLPVWNGELYLELHRGTYTTQSRNKRANRKSEFLMHDAEFLAAWASTLDSNYAYPAHEIHEAWKLICLNQFHDIIPGSSITAVYTESQEQYATVRQWGESARDGALKVIAEHIGGAVVVVNSTSFARNDLAFWPGKLAEGQHFVSADNSPVYSQATADGTWIDLGEIQPFSAVSLFLQIDAALTSNTLTATPTLLENDHVRVELNSDGDITRIFDKTQGREVLTPGKVAGQFQAFEDRPLNWDAWDVDIHFDDRLWTSEPANSVTVIESGPLRATLEIKRRILNSTYTQRVSIRHNSPQIDFDTEIDWDEKHIMLKAAFPVDILAPTATYEIQYGNVERPTHRNTSWDWARFETCAQKWVDLGEGDYGVSLLNDCKYGHDIHAKVIRVSLLRSPTNPDPVADEGHHRFAYSLLPHAGDWRESTIAAAYALNDPLLVATGSESKNQSSLAPMLSVDSDNIVIETVKRAEDGDGIIVRLYECQRRRGQFTLQAGFEITAAAITNLLEDDQETIEVTDGHAITLAYRPYQIMTLRLRTR